MDKLFENPLLDDLYVDRCEELENEYIAKYGTPKEREKFLKADDDFTDIFNDIAKGPEEVQKLSDGFLEYNRWARHDSEFWRKQNYKQGIGDCICLIQELIKVFQTKKISNTKDNIFNKIILEFLFFLSQDGESYKNTVETDEFIIELKERIEELDTEILDCIDTYMEADNHNHIMQLITKKNEKITKLNNRKQQIIEQSLFENLTNFNLDITPTT